MMQATSHNQGSFVISLDFELMWGMIDCSSKSGYGQTNVKQVPTVINRLLELFERYGVHATFATVGMIMYRGKEELLKDLPLANHPSYDKYEMSPYENGYISGIAPEEESLFFQLGLIEKIKSTVGMEIGTHTYCHYYCWERGQNLCQFEEDIRKAVSVAEFHGLSLRSIVFPRNQVSSDYLAVCDKYGITSYRGNAKCFFEQSTNRITTLKNRICRFLDSYINVGGNTDISYDDIDLTKKPMNIQASRFIRPYSARLRFFDGLRFRRIRKEMLHAARYGKLYHIWWHPHNFGMNIDENLRFIEQILEVYQDCQNRYGMQSFTMDEFRNHLINLKQL